MTRNERRTATLALQRLCSVAHAMHRNGAHHLAGELHGIIQDIAPALRRDPPAAAANQQASKMVSHQPNATQTSNATSPDQHPSQANQTRV